MWTMCNVQFNESSEWLKQVLDWVLNKAPAPDALVSIVSVKCLVPAYCQQLPTLFFSLNKQGLCRSKYMLETYGFFCGNGLRCCLSLTMGLQYWTRSGSYDGNNFIVGKNKGEKLSTILNSCSYIIVLPNPGPQMCCFVGLYASIPSLACSEAGVRVWF